MGLFNKTTSKGPLQKPNALAVTLVILSIIIVVLAAAATAVEITGRWHTGHLKSLWIAIYAIGGLSAAITLTSLAVLLQYLFSLATSSRLLVHLQQREQAREEPSVAGAEAPSAEAPTGEALSAAQSDAVVELLNEIVDNTLLDDSERREKREVYRRQQLENMTDSIRRHIDDTQWADARRLLDVFRRRYADHPDADALEKELTSAVREYEDAEITSAGEHISSYISLSLWDRALELAQQTADSYPDNVDAQRLVETVMIELQATQKDECRRMYQEIEHLVSRKKWQEAHDTAEALIKDHPDTPEAHKLKSQIEELKHNAEVRDRREMEELITSFLHQSDYVQAHNVAVELIGKYPGSPQAKALKERMEWLRLQAGIVAK
ncbi:MAG: hypothetical protein QGD94_08130 [Planctomycetia bacterium]|nr:hypothetical protein [Planctomycetia bacterium]